MTSDEELKSRRRVLQQLAAGLTIPALAACEADKPLEVARPAPGPAPAPAPSPPGLPAAPPAPDLFPFLKGEVGVVAPQFTYGHGSRYGIRTDGTDTTQEVLNWRDSIFGIGTYDDGYGLKHPRCKAVLPAGVIRVREPRALLDIGRNKGPVLWGYTIEGEGTRLTTVIYDPKTPGPLLFAANRVYGLVVRNLHFATPGNLKEPQDWLLSQSVGKQQYFTFENLAFDGPWRAGVRLSAMPDDPHGGDTNSEFKFDRINIGAVFQDAFLCDAEDDALKSSQFVNYWFSNVNMAVTTGRLVRLRRGGHVTITNLDVSGYRPAAETYVIDLPEVVHSDGTHSLMIRNARFESLSEHARFLRCRWERGNVCIDGYNDIVWRSTTRPTFEIRAGNSVSDDSFGNFGEGKSGAGAQYWFANGRFTGVHRYICRGTRGDEEDNVPATIQYQNCEFCGPHGEAHSRNINAFVRMVPDGNKAPMFRPHIRFRACRVEAVPNHVTDWDLGIHDAHVTGNAPIKAVRFGTPTSGRLPSGDAASIVLPPGALVLRVTWILPGGRAPEGKRAYRFELSNGYERGAGAQTLAVFEGEDFNAPASRVDLLAHDTVPRPLPAGFDPIRSATLLLRETRAPGVHPLAQCIVEYI